MTDMPLRTPSKVALVALLWFVAVVPAARAEFDSGCSADALSRYVDIDSDGNQDFDEQALRVFGADEGAALHVDATGEAADGHVVFNDRYWILDPGSGDGRMQIAHAGETRPLGWVERSAVLCQMEPLRDAETGLWRRVYIQTATRSIGRASGDENEGVTEIEPKPLFRGPQESCDDTCRTVSRFEWFYVYGDSGNRLLLAKDVGLRANQTSGLHGWLSDEDGIPWNSSSALRPSEFIEDPEVLCAYPTLEDLRAQKSCREFLGGYRWFEIDLRLPVIDETEEAWKVIFKGGGNNLDRDALLEELALGQQREGLANLDVFFLIDGTQSIKPAIDAIKGDATRPGLIDQLRNRLSTKLQSGGHFRVGFRVFRDSDSLGSDGISNSEHLALSDLDCRTDNSEFSTRFSEVVAQDIVADDRDFEENLLGGLQQAMRDIRGCPSHLKVVILIGDHGYSPEAQRARGQTATQVEQIVRQMQNTREFASPPLVFFLQLPRADMSGIRNKAGYTWAYDHPDNPYSFEGLAKWFINEQAAFYTRRATSRMTASDMRNLVEEMQRNMFTRLPEGNVTKAVIDEITTRMDGYLNPPEASATGQGGQSIVESIEILQRRSQGVPILWWRMAEQRFCDAAPQQCTENLLEKVDELYISKADADKLVPEVMMAASQLRDWLSVLRGFNLSTGTDELNQSLLEVLTRSLEDSLALQLHEVRDADGNPRELGDIIQMAVGLPSGFGSDLLSYRPADFRSDAGMEFCERAILAELAGRHIEILETVREGDTLPRYDVNEPDRIYCPGLSQRGQNLRMPDPTSMRYERLNEAGAEAIRDITFNDDTSVLYWVPQRYLP